MITKERFKKVIKIAGIILVAMLILSTCGTPSEDIVEEPDKAVETPIVVEEPVVEVPEVEEPVEEDPTKATDEELEYVAYTSGVLEEYSETMSDFGELMINPSNTDEWTLNVVADILILKEIATNFLEYEKEVPERFKVSHGHLENAMGESLKALEIIPSAIDNSDVSAMEQATLHINKSGEYMQLSTAEIKRVTEEFKGE